MSRSHCIGRKGLGSNRPHFITIKFARYVWSKVFRNKRKLIDKGVSVNESLTKTRIEKLQKVSGEHEFGLECRWEGLYNRLKTYGFDFCCKLSK